MCQEGALCRRQRIMVPPLVMSGHVAMQGALLALCMPVCGGSWRCCGRRSLGMWADVWVFLQHASHAAARLHGPPEPALAPTAGSLSLQL